MTSKEKSQLIEFFKDLYMTLVDANPELGFDADGQPMKIDDIDFTNFEVQDLLNVWDLARLEMKYLVFDSEACRREIEELQHQQHEASDDSTE